MNTFIVALLGRILWGWLGVHLELLIVYWAFDKDTWQLAELSNFLGLLKCKASRIMGVPDMCRLHSLQRHPIGLH